MKKFREHKVKGKSTSHWHGYIRLRIPDHPSADSQGYIMEHRYVMEKHLRRYLNRNEVIHHKNGNCADNRLMNLLLFPDNGAHTRFHYRLKARKMHLGEKLNGIS